MDTGTGCGRQRRCNGKSRRAGAALYKSAKAHTLKFQPEIADQPKLHAPSDAKPSAAAGSVAICRRVGGMMSPSGDDDDAAAAAAAAAAQSTAAHRRRARMLRLFS